jgi:hypothetical protein
MAPRSVSKKQGRFPEIHQLGRELFEPRSSKRIIEKPDALLVSPLFDKEKRRALLSTVKKSQKSSNLIQPTSPLATPIHGNRKTETLPNSSLDKSSSKTIPDTTSHQISMLKNSKPENETVRSKTVTHTANIPSSPSPTTDDVSSTNTPIGFKSPLPKPTPNSGSNGAYKTYAEGIYDTKYSEVDGISKKLLPKFSEGLNIAPSIDVLEKMPEEELKEVSDFVIIKSGFGSIRFLEPVDVRGLDIDEIVQFHDQEIIVYPEKSPPPGKGLNKPAEITLERCWPTDKMNRPIKDNPKLTRSFIEKLKRRSVRIGCKFVDYNVEKGEWKFRTDHF